MGFLDDCIPPDGGCKAAIAALAVVPPVNWFAGASLRGGVRVGVAGYMGAGKSTCARSFEGCGALVIDADAEAKRLMRGSVGIQDGLRRAFGDDVVADGGLRVDALGRAAFASVDALRVLNGIVHPRLVEHLEGLVFGCVEPLCILDAALIPLWGIEGWFDLCVWVDAPFDVRLERIVAKSVGGDGGSMVDEQEIARRMRMQEEVMGVPTGDVWVRVPDSECREYIKINALNQKSTPPPHHPTTH